MLHVCVLSDNVLLCYEWCRGMVRGRYRELMSHWLFIGTDRRHIAKCCLSSVRQMEDGTCCVQS